MDLNIALAAATTTTTSTAIVNNNQENNQLLLNAIKNKFSAQTATEAAAFSPPKFNIPLLKIPGGSLSANQIKDNDKNTSQFINNTTTSSQLNNFLLKKLQEKHTTTTATSNGFTTTTNNNTGFVLPQLQLTTNNSKEQQQQQTIKFELPSNVSSLTSSLDKLKVQEPAPDVAKTPAIDLTAALASKLHNHQGTPPTRDFVKPSSVKEIDLDFEIPFIDCDRLDNNNRKTKLTLPTSNEYCITDISELLLQHSLVDEPSAIGRFLNTDEQKYLNPLPLKCLSLDYHQQKVKHYIKPFDFQTKSPDDLVLEALNKYQRRHYN